MSRGLTYKRHQRGRAINRGLRQAQLSYWPYAYVDGDPLKGGGSFRSLEDYMSEVWSVPGKMVKKKPLDCGKTRCSTCSREDRARTLKDRTQVVAEACLEGYEAPSRMD
jgi:hypothetical protein